MLKNVDLPILIRQEQVLQFIQFNEEIAWQLGSAIYNRASAEKLPVVIDIRRFGNPLFFAARSGVTLDNHDWVKRKVNTVQRFLRSSYRIGHELALQNLDITQRYYLSPAEFTSAGGGFPLIVEKVGVIGSIVVSGLPERHDHQLIVDALCDFLGHDRKEFMLSEEE